MFFLKKRSPQTKKKKKGRELRMGSVTKTELPIKEKRRRRRGSIKYTARDKEMHYIDDVMTHRSEHYVHCRKFGWAGTKRVDHRIVETRVRVRASAVLLKARPW